MSILSKLNFDDFYKFIMSVGILFILVGISLSLYFSVSNILIKEVFYENWFIWIITLIISIIIFIKLIYWAGERWYTNQKLLDRKLKAECELSEKEVSKISLPDSDILAKPGVRKNVALIEYKIDSVLPGTVHFDLIKDKKVWFWIANLEEKKYLAYIKVKLKIGDYFRDLDDRYYGGKEPWKLNAFTGIHAPGMPIFPEVIERVKKGEPLDITINCEVKDENNVFIEKKLPVTYRYSRQTNTWYLEP